MLTIFTGPTTRETAGWSRRDFLQIGASSLAGVSLPGLLRAKEDQRAGGPSFVRDKSVVLLYLSGGASHIETFDPHLDAPDGVRSVTGEVSTRIAGVTFGGTFPQLAEQAHRLSVVRSFAHSVGAHEQAHVHVLSGGTDAAGKQQSGHSMGSFYARLRGTNHPDTGLPTYCLLTEEEVDGQYVKELGRVKKGSWPGSLGASYGPFQHQIGWRTEPIAGRRQGKSKQRGAENPLAASMQLSLPEKDLDNRLGLLKRIDRLNRRLDATGAMEAADKFHAQAVGLLLGGAADAFDFRQENRSSLERYDTSQIPIGFKVFRPSTLGKQMLVARRLCEAGCGFVTVHSAGWDMHADGNNPGMQLGMQMLGRSLDKAVSAFLEDLEQRGLSDKILLVITGDFGRTPKVNKRGGRDHWARLGTLAFAGGGLRMGQVIGKSTRNADAPASDPISPASLMTTVMHTLFDPGQLRLARDVPRSLAAGVERAQPIKELF